MKLTLHTFLSLDGLVRRDRRGSLRPHHLEQRKARSGVGDIEVIDGKEVIHTA